LATRIEKTLVTIEQSFPELGDGSLLRLEVDSSEGRATLTYSSVETTVSIPFPVLGLPLAGEFFASAIADSAVLGAMATQKAAREAAAQAAKDAAKAAEKAARDAAKAAPAEIAPPINPEPESDSPPAV
jgi:hypothetical protein